MERFHKREFVLIFPSIFQRLNLLFSFLQFTDLSLGQTIFDAENHLTAEMGMPRSAEFSSMTKIHAPNSRNSNGVEPRNQLQIP